ncbi:MAG TPA: carboxypeptidase regulatory-like domain-containing protein [Vicinamibacteria bacterium]|nr:carboxypeptidase regulatory-like domain-containing protein [Vicinamibacteria bacterium]
MVPLVLVLFVGGAVAASADGDSSPGLRVLAPRGRPTGLQRHGPESAHEIAAPVRVQGVDPAVLGRISGLVTDGATGAALANVWVDILDSSGSLVSYGETDGAGAYTASGLLAGSYYALTWNGAGYFDVLYQGVPCPLRSCDVTSGTPIVVRPGATTAGIDFPLPRGGRITGRLTDAVTGLPIASAYVDVFDSSGQAVTYGTADSSGTYTQYSGLPSGTYYVRTEAYSYLDELYADIPCVQGACTVTSGTPIAVTTGLATTGIDFSLTPGGRISGTVKEAVTGQPVPADVEVYDSSGVHVAEAYTDPAGAYVAVGLLASGTYYAEAVTSDRYLDQLYQGIPCPISCTPTSGTPIGVTVGATTTGIDFALSPQLEGRISGTVRTAAGAPLADTWVYVYGSAGSYVKYAYTDSAGHYLVSGLTAAGNYYLVTSNYQGYLDQLYNGIPCATGCIVASGTPVAVTLGTTTTGIDFALAPGGRISGTVRDTSTGQPIVGMYVDLYDSAGNWLVEAETNAVGVYTSARGLVSGTYFARTGGGLYPYQLYRNLTCPDPCTVTAGTPIAVTAGAITTGIAFNLTPMGRISGTVRDAANGQPLADIEVWVYDSAGREVDLGFTDGSGAYTTDIGVPTGTYYARTANSLGYQDQLYRGVSCAGGTCTVTEGTPIGVTVPAVTHGIDFTLAHPTAFYTLAPCRVADTRQPASPWGGPALVANAARVFPVNGLCSVPPTATAVALNVTVVDPTDRGDLRLFAAGGPPTGSSTVNFAAGKTRANNAVVPLSVDGQIAVQCDMPEGSAGRAHFLIDVTGYFQ